jgi:glutamyl-Q tRNA(Asp) synthetase
MLAHDMARAAGGAFLLRIEDIDRQRSKPQWEQAIFDDLEWLGLTWETPVMRQSERRGVYREALRSLWHRDLVYPCTCNRRDIAEAAAAPQEGAVVLGPDGVVYPGTCKAHRPRREPGVFPPENAALRVDIARAWNAVEALGTGEETHFIEAGQGPGGETGRIGVTLDQFEAEIGDIVVSRRDMGTSYHLAVVVDDAAQEVTHVVRGQDLFEATKIHVLLQRLLGLATPVYHHHRLIRDDAGKRLAKRDDARAISTYRAEGATPSDIRRMVGL